ncbi:MAG: High potential iron-sulfur protein [Alphaproteobacteria bacterium]|nr:High potential iron-sulfur protein [Alphaproteobacteria bacterium]
MSKDGTAQRRARLSRRAALLTVPIAGALTASAAEPAADKALPRLDPNDPIARDLAYYENAADVDTSNEMAAHYLPGQTCNNCAQIQGDARDAWRPCTIFPGKSVAGAGWCGVWVEKV